MNLYNFLEQMRVTEIEVRNDDNKFTPLKWHEKENQLMGFKSLNFKI